MDLLDVVGVVTLDLLVLVPRLEDTLLEVVAFCLELALLLVDVLPVA